MKKPPFTGSATAMVTPFLPDGSVNYDKLGQLIEFQISSGTDAIVVLGTSGENATLNDNERREIIRFSVECVRSRVPVIAGTGSNDTKHAVALSRFAFGAGADALLCVTPYYNKASQEGLITHFYSIADSVQIPVILYNVPSRTGISIGIDAYKELCRHENITATKEASGDISFIAKVAAECGNELHIYSGNDDQTVPILALGGNGVISVLSNIMPKEMHEICKLWARGSIHEAAALHIKLMDIMDALFMDVNPIPVKAAMNLMGLEVGGYRLPLCEMPAGKLERLRAAMEAVSLI